MCLQYSILHWSFPYACHGLSQKASGISVSVHKPTVSWLFLKHSYVHLRFILQSSGEKQASIISRKWFAVWENVLMQAIYLLFITNFTISRPVFFLEKLLKVWIIENKNHVYNRCNCNGNILRQSKCSMVSITWCRSFLIACISCLNMADLYAMASSLRFFFLPPK